MKKIIFLVILILIMSINICFAQSEMKIITNKQVVMENEEIELNIEIPETPVAALTIEIYYDNTKLEYIKGPENSNKTDSRILYTWVTETGDNEKNINLGSFIFKGIEKGNANIVVVGEFYNASGESLQINNENIEIKIGNNEQEEQQEDNVKPKNVEDNKNVSDDNANLKIFRINHVGMTPEFNKDTKEYYFIADDTINTLEVTAIPENEGAKVTISGNENLKIGLNVINIYVQSKDSSKTETYKIYVTKTSNVEMANANLENLAIRQAILNPEFDANVTNYYIEVANNVDKLDILAISQDIKASVKITGNDQLKVGGNRVNIIVVAQDGITTKKYEIIVYRRNEAEEEENKEERNVQMEKLSTILEENKEDRIDEITPNNEKENKSNLAFICIAVIISIVITIIIMHIIRKGKKR